ncbi:TonB-dependent receptor plug domain-containing protein [Persephonella sp.]
MKKSLTAILSLSFLSTFSYGYELDKVNIYSAYGTNSSIHETTSPVEVITDKEIEEKHPFDFKEIIENKSGISFSSNGGFGQTVSIYLWGNKTEHTVLMIDGIRINDVTAIGGNPLYEHLLMEDIQQIEIVKGSQSGVWGADAIGGVINIVTKKPEKGFHIKTYGLYGSYITRKYGVTVSYGSEKMDLLLGLHHFKTSGFSAAEPTKNSPLYGNRWDELGLERDPYRNDTVNFKTNFYITPKDTVEAVIKSINAVVHYDAGAGIDAKDYDDPFGFGISEYFNHISQKFYKVGYKKSVGNHNIDIYTTKSDFKRTQFGGYEGRYIEYTFMDRYDYKKGFIIFGVSRQDFINTKSGGVDLDKRYHNYGYYLTNVYKTKKTIISQSIRYDRYSAFDNKTTYKLGIKHYLSKKLYISANYGTSYKVPTIYQLYGSFVGNPDLNPENGKQYDITVGHKNLSVSYFNFKIKDLIDYVPTGMYSGEYQNISGTSKINGVELKYDRYLRSIRSYISLNYTYLDAKDAKGNKLLRRPQNKVGFDLIWYPSNRINIGLSGVYIGKRKDLNNVQTGYYTVIDIFGDFRISKNLLAYLKIKNVTDKYYQIIDGYATDERSLYAGLQLKW